MDEVERLVDEILRSGVKHAWLAAEAGISKTKLSRILSGQKKEVDVRLWVRLVRALKERPAAFLGDPDSPLLTADLESIRDAVSLLYDKFVRPEQVAAQPNAALVTDTIGRVSRRRGVVAQNAKRAKRYRAAATPDRETYLDEWDLPEREIPTYYAQKGAKYVFKAEGDSMRDVGITDRDLLFVRPETDPRAAHGQVVVCRVGGFEYVKQLEFRRGRIRLLSANERYHPRVIEEADEFELIGVVVGRSGDVAT